MDKISIMDEEHLSTFLDGMTNWLLNSGICLDNGEIYSWLNPEKPGYRYPEIQGYYIKLLSYLYQKFSDKKCMDKAHICANNLSASLLNDGSVGKDGLKYAFDSAICFSGLFALSRVSRLSELHLSALKKSIDFFYNSVKSKKSVFKNGIAFEDPNIWSLSYGALLIKNSISLLEAYEFFKEDKYRKLAESMVDELFKQTYHKGYFSINSANTYAYTHCHCYATEGMIYLNHKGYTQFKEVPLQCADWLASKQNDDGSMYNWQMTDKFKKEKQGDATSQAIRIWLLTDKNRFKHNISKATGFLKSLQSPGGGLYYNVNSEGRRSEDMNSWVTIFAAQATLWQLEDPDPLWIV